jgi:hypothetical protein
MIVARIWNDHADGFGHAAVQITDSGPNDCYISWWPAGTGRQAKAPLLAEQRYSLKVARLFSNWYSAPANKGQTFEMDKRLEARDPDIAPLQVLGLNEANIKAWWDDFQANPPNWSSLGVNCAMVAAYALRAGGADDVISGFQGWWRSWNTIWKPADVVELVEAINRGALAKS